jgi:cyclophilin family peptidyl-prolyl cis-trans isomerase
MFVFIITGLMMVPLTIHAKEGEKMIRVSIETNKGTIVAELDAEKAPVSVENFVSYAKKGHYNGTIYHRVIDGFMIQGGGFTQEMEMKKTDPQIKNEADNGLKNTRGTLAMARTSVVDSATSQFSSTLWTMDFSTIVTSHRRATVTLSSAK